MVQSILVRLRSGLWLHAPFAGLTLIYVLIFLQTTSDGLVSNVESAIANVLPAWILSFGVAAIVDRGLIRLPSQLQIAVHIPLALGFTASWYMLLNLCRALSAVPDLGRFEMNVLTGPALYWQSFQGLLLYVAIALGATLRAVTRRLEPLAIDPSPSRAAADPKPLLMRRGEQVRPVRPEDIILVRGADDYCEVFTNGGPHLARVTLSALFARLEGAAFVQVHRSWVVNMSRVSRVESVGGGRMQVEMDNGLTAPASRAGARRLRELLL